MIKEILSKYKFDVRSDRLGPDCPFTHWRLYFKKKMVKICQEKFKKFDQSAEFRAGAYAVYCSKISIGENVIIRPNCMLFAEPRDGEDGKQGRITIENDVMMGSGVHIYVSNHRYDIPNLSIIKQGHSEPKSVILKEGCWIGANVIILPGVVVGRNAVVGAGSIVTRNVEDNCIYAGNPAMKIREI
ncbi:acetyltransferase [Gammaproteobacteria bacterium 42_54_T18]|nr:acetyltransferase [Gammaproteobacteria bacterium 42_54_T18]